MTSLDKAQQCRPMWCSVTVTLQLKLMMTGVKLQSSHAKSSQSASRHRVTADETAWGTPGTEAKQRTDDEVKIEEKTMKTKRRTTKRRSPGKQKTSGKIQTEFHS